MPLHKDIATEIAAGRLADPWTTADLIVNPKLNSNYALTTLRTEPPNRSVSATNTNLNDGHNVNSDSPVYLRVGKRKHALLFSLVIESDSRITTYDDLQTDGAGADQKHPSLVCGSANNTDYELRKQLSISGSDLHAPQDILRQFVQDINDREPWDLRLKAYEWAGRNFYQTQDYLSTILDDGKKLVEAIDQGVPWATDDRFRAERWAMQIFAWGGTHQKKPISFDKVQKTLTNALCNRIVFPDAPMNSGYSKLAAFGTAFLEGVPGKYPQVIFDTRVASSLTSGIDAILRNHEYADPSVLFPGLGHLKGVQRHKSKLNLHHSWPNAYRHWTGQFAASRVVVQMQSILNDNPKFPCMPDRNGSDCHWTMRGVEAILFMDGKSTA